MKLRDEFKLNDFREPHGLILIGREGELQDDPQKKKLRAHWNRLFDGKIEIRTFDSLLRTLEDTFRFHEAQKESLKKWIENLPEDLRKKTKKPQ